MVLPYQVIPNANNIAKVSLFPNNFAPGRFERCGDMGKMEQEEPESEVANRECPLNRRGAGEGAAHNFWEIKMGSGLDLVSLAGGHYVIFLHVRLVFLLTKF